MASAANKVLIYCKISVRRVTIKKTENKVQSSETKFLQDVKGETRADRIRNQNIHDGQNVYSNNE